MALGFGQLVKQGRDEEEKRKERMLAAAQEVARQKSQQEDLAQIPEQQSTFRPSAGRATNVGTGDVERETPSLRPSLFRREEPRREEPPPWRRSYDLPDLPEVPAAAQDWWRSSKPERDIAGEIFRQRSDQYGQAMKSFGLGLEDKGPIPGVMGKAVELSANVGAGKILPAFDWTYQTAGALRVPGTDLSLGQAVGIGMDTVGKVNERIFQQKEEAAKGRTLETPQDYWDALVQNGQIVFDNFGDFAQYYMDGVDAYNAGLTPTPEQLQRNSPEQIAQARALGRFMGYSGVQAGTEAYDEYLDNPILGKTQIAQAEQLMEQAYQVPEGPEREAMLIQAAQLGAEGVKLRDQTLLEVYDDNQVWWRELAAGLVLDPTNAIGLVGDVGKLIGVLPGGISPMGRRAAEAMKLGSMAEDAAVGTSINRLGSIVENTVGEWMKTGTSKALNDGFWSWNGVINLVSPVTDPRDVVTILDDLIRDPVKLANEGIDITRLFSPGMTNQADSLGRFRFGWAGIKEQKFQKAMKVMQQDGFIDAVKMLPSIRDGGAILDQQQFMGDLNGLIARWAGWKYGVSAMGNVPYGATTARVVDGAVPGTKAIEFADGSNVLSRTTDMSQQDAFHGVQQAEKAIKRGEEYRRNPMTMVADFQRNFFSSLALNANPSSIARNILGGMGMGFINTNGDFRLFNRLDSNLAFLKSKYSGLLPDLRVASGAGNLPGPTGINVSSKGYWRGSDIVNKVLFGLPEKGRQFRNWSEEYMYTNVYATGFKQGFENGVRGLRKDIEKLVGEFLTDPKQANDVVEQLVDAVIHGGRGDVAQTAVDIAAGKPAVTLRQLSPAYAEILQPQDVVEINTLLRNLTASNADQVAARIDEIFNLHLGNTLTEVGAMATPKRFYWTVADRMKDRAEFITTLQNGTKGVNPRITQDQYRALMPLMKEADQIAQEADTALLGLMQATYNRPDTMDVVYGAYLESKKIVEGLRREHSEVWRDVVERVNTLRQAGYNEVQLGQEKSRLWSTFYDYYTRLAGEAAKKRLKVFEDAYDSIHSGSYKTAPALSQWGLRKMLLTMGVDESLPETFYKKGLQFASDDEGLFNSMVKAQRRTTDKFQLQMFLAFQANPTMNSMDEFMSALNQVSRRNAQHAANVRKAFEPIEALRAQGVVDADIPKNLWDAARKAREGWQRGTQLNWKRMQAASTRIIEDKLLDDVLAPLNFTVPGSKDTYYLAGKGSGTKWVVINKRTGKTLYWDESVVPKNVIDFWPQAEKAGKRAVAEQVAALAGRAGLEGTGIPDLDRMIQEVVKNPHDDVYAAIRQNVIDHMANPNPGVVVPANLEDYVIETTQAAQYALHKILPKILEMGEQGYGKLGAGFLGRLNGEILPKIDNLLAQADRTGKSAASISMVNYLNQYWADAVLGMFAPYHFWFTRMAKNSLEQAVFNPAITANMSRLYNKVFAENQQQDVPNRNMFQIPGVGFDMNEAYVQFDLPFAQWIPIFPLMVQYGWADPNRTNAAYEFLSDSMTEGAFPGSKNKILGNALMAAEVAKRFGVGVYPWQDAALGAAAGLRGEANLGSLGPIPRMLGNGGVMFSQWLREQGAEGAGQLVDVATQPMRPFYEPYLAARQATFGAAQGEMSDIEAQNVQDVGYQKFFGAEPLPEQLPGAEELYQQTRGRVSQDYFYRQLLGWLFPGRFTANYHGEKELTEAARMRSAMGFESEDNRGGSRESQLAMYDQVPGLSARSSQYATTAESAPQTPDPDAKRPGISAAQSAFFEQRDAIYAKYNAIIEEEYGKHPEWGQAGNSKEERAVTDPIMAEREAELEALKARYPSIQDIEAAPANAPNKLRGTNPREALGIAKVMVVKMAQEANKELNPGDYPTNGSRSEKAVWNERKAAYNAAVAATMGQLMAQPDIGGQLVPGRELPGAGVQPEGQPIQLPPAGSPAPPPPQQQGWRPPGTETQAYGNQNDYYTAMGFAGHEGVDYGTAVGTPVQAAASGTVVQAGEKSGNEAYGTYVVVRHADGKETWYAHLDGTNVKVGDKVNTGDVVGLSGNTGNTTGPHLHFAVRDPAQSEDDMKGFIDPAVWLGGMSQGLPTEVGVAIQPPVPGQGQPAPSPANNIAWGQTPEEILESGSNRFKGPNQLAAEQSVSKQYAEMDARLQQVYPDLVGIKDAWDKTNDEDRKEFKRQYPEIAAVNFLLWNQDAWQTVEGKFGSGTMLEWARRPAYEENSTARSDYYDQHPNAFLASAWISGRPTAKTETSGDDEDFSYNLGKDYAEAEKRFGADIWQVVIQARQMPDYEKGNKLLGKAWADFHDQYPQYSQWRDWWYANLPDKYEKKSGYQSYGGFSSSGYSFPKKEPRLETHPPNPYRKSYNISEPAKYTPPSGMGSDWESWMNRAMSAWRR